MELTKREAIAFNLYKTLLEREHETIAKSTTTETGRRIMRSLAKAAVSQADDFLSALDENKPEESIRLSQIRESTIFEGDR